MNRTAARSRAGFGLGLLLACGLALHGADPVSGPGYAARLWTTDPWDPARLLAESAPLAAAAGPVGKRDIAIRPDRSYQLMEGFGASLTESAAVSLMALPGPERDRVMRLLFDPVAGLGISLLRQPMGASDFAVSVYSYDDLPAGQTDPELSRFNLDREQAAILPLLRQAKALNPGLRIIGSPWSPPAWMKTGGSMLGSQGGVLKPEYYQSYAQYFVKFIQAYAAEGLPVVAVTPQNEMNYAPAAYPGMVWSAAEEGAFIQKALGPALRKAGLPTKILAWDHNWDRVDIARQLLDDPATRGFVAGIAWHWYGGSPQAMADTLAAWPGTEAWFTEGGSGTWIGGNSFHGQFKEGIRQAVAICANGAKSLIWWNLALDQKNGPVVFPNTANHGLVTVDTASRTVAEPHRSGFYTLAHFSRFVLPGATRIGCDNASQDLQTVAFRNPDGTVVVVLANVYMSAQSGRVVLGMQAWDVEVPGEGAATLVIGGHSGFGYDKMDSDASVGAPMP